MSYGRKKVPFSATVTRISSATSSLIGGNCSETRISSAKHHPVQLVGLLIQVELQYSVIHMDDVNMGFVYITLQVV